jgi:hypothetical protein
MSEKEKELKKLEEYLYREISDLCSKYRETLIKTISKHLAERGYTKSHFPIGKIVNMIEKRRDKDGMLILLSDEVDELLYELKEA